MTLRHTLRVLFTVLTLTAPALTLTGCERKEGPAEELGEAVDDAYRNPPVSTEQILHPQKFRAEPDHPTLVEFGDLEPGEGWRELGQNVLGEFQIRVMLRRQRGEVAAEGWDGDRYAVFEGPEMKQPKGFSESLSPMRS